MSICSVKILGFRGRQGEADCSFQQRRSTVFSCDPNRHEWLDRNFIDQIKGAAKAFVAQLRPADSVRPIYFHGEIKPLADAGINDPKLFGAAIDQIKPGPVNMGTRMYDAVAFGLSALRPVSGRKAVILITDGENTWGKATMKGTLRDAEESDTVVYTVQYGDLEPQNYLQQLA